MERLYATILEEELENTIFANSPPLRYEECERPTRWLMMLWGHQLPIITREGEEDIQPILHGLQYCLRT
ncbi:hypothetical protein NXS19_004297 [Fusarium pseudograminearum]|nr:hypothetical protein NXS19_004297 [Fusarium pseudograminearum]